MATTTTSKSTPPKLFNDMGFLSAEGREQVKDLRELVSYYLRQGKTQSEVQLIGSLLMNVVGTQVTDVLREK